MKHFAGMLTLDGAVAVELRADHLQTEDQDGQREDDTDAKAGSPDSGEMIFSRSRQDNEVYA